MKTFFTADLHLGHKNCLKYDQRPFETIEEHDAEIVRRWNAAVGADDEVWILGDVSWLKPKDTAEIMRSLNGTKNLVTGNHDTNLIKNTDFVSCFKVITPYKELHISKGFRLVLCHYPIPCFNNHFGGWCHLYAHVHMSAEWEMMKACKRDFERGGKLCRMINVGCMLPYMDYTPRTLDELLDVCGEN